MLELACEALEDAGLPPCALAGTQAGVYVGVVVPDLRRTLHCRSRGAGCLFHAGHGAVLAGQPGLLRFRPAGTEPDGGHRLLVLAGGAAPGMQAICRGEIGVALVGGVNLLLTPHLLRRLCARLDAVAGRPLPRRSTPRRRLCSRRGWRGGGAEAAGDGARRRRRLSGRDRRGTGVNSDGRTSGFTVPSGEAAGGADARRLGDPGSSRRSAISRRTAPARRSATRSRPHAIGTALAQRRRAALPIGSVKSNIGHLEPASGMAGLTKLDPGL